MAIPLQVRFCTLFSRYKYKPTFHSVYFPLKNEQKKQIACQPLCLFLKTRNKIPLDTYLFSTVESINLQNYMCSSIYLCRRWDGDKFYQENKKQGILDNSTSLEICVQD